MVKSGRDYVVLVLRVRENPPVVTAPIIRTVFIDEHAVPIIPLTFH